MLSHLKFSPAKLFLSTDITNHAFDSYISIQESNKNSDHPHFIKELIQTQIFIFFIDVIPWPAKEVDFA